MASLLLVVFLLQLIIHLINKFGAGFINNGVRQQTGAARFGLT
jgi:hypothetical protein